MDTLSQVLLSLAPYVVPPILAVLTYLVKSYIDKLPVNQRSFLSGIISSAVNAVEQEAGSDVSGTSKKQLATEFIEAELAHWKINVPASLISILIEDAVRQMHEWDTLSKGSVVPAPSASEDK